jgi:hypothetical protein
MTVLSYSENSQLFLHSWRDTSTVKELFAGFACNPERSANSLITFLMHCTDFTVASKKTSKLSAKKQIWVFVDDTKEKGL